MFKLTSDIQMGIATRAIWPAIKKYSVSVARIHTYLVQFFILEFDNFCFMMHNGSLIKTGSHMCLVCNFNNYKQIIDVIIDY